MDQVDSLSVYNGDSVSNVRWFSDYRITGLGMGDDITINYEHVDGGITYNDLESLSLELGSGADNVTIESTHSGLTNLQTNAGDDIIDINNAGGHVLVDGGDGSDQVTVADDSNLTNQIGGLLTVVGSSTTGSDTLNVDDSGESNNNSASLTSTTLTGLDMSQLTEIQTITVRADSGTLVLSANVWNHEDCEYRLAEKSCQLGWPCGNR